MSDYLRRALLPGLTIVIPNWNHEYVLPRAIRSALEASRQLREHGVACDVLVLDDGSRDGSITLLRQLEALYFEQGLQVLLLGKNSGRPGAARNAVLEHPTYQHVIFLDADNELLPENIYHFYRSARQTGAAVVYGNIIRRVSDEQASSVISNESFQGRMFHINYIDALSLIDRNQLLDLGTYSTNAVVDAAEDWELYLHFAANGRLIIFVPLVFGFYYIIPLSMTDQFADEQIHAKRHRHLRRTYDQLGIREDNFLNTRHKRYHPDLGFI